VLEHSDSQLSLPFFADRKLIVQRHVGRISSDAGLLPIRQLDQRLQFTRRLAAGLNDDRHEPRHTQLEMLRQRLYGILADYEDCNDHDTLRDDPIFKIVADRLPEDDPLASQPTLSRFENAVTIDTLWATLDFLTTTGIERLCQKNGGRLPERLTLDLDATDDPAYGQQQLVLFHGYYEQHQYFPIVISEPTTQHVLYAALRPGNAHAALGADDDLQFVVDRLRRARADVAIHVRGDSGFGVPWMYNICEKNRLTYTFGIGANKRLQALAQPLLDQAVAEYERTGEKQRLFMRFDYQANSWDRPRTVIAKAECQAVGTNLRFVVTNLEVSSAADAQRVYDDYVQRGASEQRFDELKNGLHADRLSCHRFVANFWRLLLHTAAFNLLNWLRDDERLAAELRTAQPATWRSRLIKVAATVVQSARRIVVAIAGQWPHWPGYLAISRRSGGRLQRVGAIPAGP
jgi:hypothetical protein